MSKQIRMVIEEFRHRSGTGLTILNKNRQEVQGPAQRNLPATLRWYKKEGWEVSDVRKIGLDGMNFLRVQYTLVREVDLQAIIREWLDRGEKADPLSDTGWFLLLERIIKERGYEADGRSTAQLLHALVEDNNDVED